MFVFSPVSRSFVPAFLATNFPAHRLTKGTERMRTNVSRFSMYLEIGISHRKWFLLLPFLYKCSQWTICCFLISNQFYYNCFGVFVWDYGFWKIVGRFEKFGFTFGFLFILWVDAVLGIFFFFLKRRVWLIFNSPSERACDAKQWKSVFSVLLLLKNFVFS